MAGCSWERWPFGRHPLLPQSHCFRSTGAEPPALAVLEAGPAGHLPQAPYLIWRKGKQAEGVFCRLSGLVETPCSPDKLARLMGEHMRCCPAGLLVEKTRSSLGIILQPCSNRGCSRSLVFSLNLLGVLRLATIMCFSPLGWRRNLGSSLPFSTGLRERKRDAMGGSEPWGH